jgi:hypothetical protein
MALQALSHSGRPFRLGVDTGLALCNHSLTFRICRCLDAKTSCKIKKASYSLIKQLLSSTQLVRLHWSGRQNTTKVDTILKAKLPRTKTELRAFIGICNVYRRFIPKFETISAPLTRHLRQDSPDSLDLQ